MQYNVLALLLCLSWPACHCDPEAVEYCGVTYAPVQTGVLDFTVSTKRSAGSCQWESEVVLGHGGDDPVLNGGWSVRVNKSRLRDNRQVVEVVASTRIKEAIRKIPCTKKEDESDVNTVVPEAVDIDVRKKNTVPIVDDSSKEKFTESTVVTKVTPATTEVTAEEVDADRGGAKVQPDNKMTGEINVDNKAVKASEGLTVDTGVVKGTDGNVENGDVKTEGGSTISLGVEKEVVDAVVTVRGEKDGSVTEVHSRDEKVTTVASDVLEVTKEEEHLDGGVVIEGKGVTTIDPSRKEAVTIDSSYQQVVTSAGAKVDGTTIVDVDPSHQQVVTSAGAEVDVDPSHQKVVTSAGAEVDVDPSHQQVVTSAGAKVDGTTIVYVDPSHQQVVTSAGAKVDGTTIVDVDPSHQQVVTSAGAKVDGTTIVDVDLSHQQEVTSERVKVDVSENIDGTKTDSSSPGKETEVGINIDNDVDVTTQETVEKSHEALTTESFIDVYPDVMEVDDLNDNDKTGQDCPLPTNTSLNNDDVHNGQCSVGS